MKTQYDLAVVLGLRLDRKWDIRSDLKKRLDETAKLYKEGTVKKIVVSGRWTIWYDWAKIKPPTTEAERMKEYLVKKGVSHKDIISEKHSKDTIGNIYYVKLLLKAKPEYKNLLIICATQHEPRIKFIIHKIFGDDYKIDFFSIPARDYKHSALGSEKRILREQKIFLAEVRSSHEEDLRNKLYNSSYYRDQAKAIEKSAAINTLQS